MTPEQQALIEKIELRAADRLDYWAIAAEMRRLVYTLDAVTVQNVALVERNAKLEKHQQTERFLLGAGAVACMSVFFRVMNNLPTTPKPGLFEVIGVVGTMVVLIVATVVCGVVGVLKWDPPK